ncbi:hypothetical protein BC351_11705 [Paenibacillus ferrarius]|uniref:Uncharacterized protein n=1 Tax=Paenibacillus ferrarius TaxID=1469647 RepID=A0A1V4H7Q1_9BACL|nr:hypothetical protein [Paenibacillus ferrarius]OPH47164.1 hypothetical protein BC351_11705 [Paenibacillus ferrarius]
MKIISSSILNFLVAMLPSVLVVWLLVEQFPFTGLGRIVALPLIFIVNSIIIIIGINQKIYKQPRYTLRYVVIVLLTIVVSILFYPQESRPHVVKQIWDTVFN